MLTTSSNSSLTYPINLRVRAETQDLIDQAAKVQGKSRSEFMIGASRKAAEDALLDHNLVLVDEATFESFFAVLDQPPRGEGFARLMQARKVWGLDA